MLRQDPNRPIVLVGLAEDPSLRRFGVKWYVLEREPAGVKLNPSERVAIDLSPLTPEEAERVLTKVVREVIRHRGGVIAVDEAHLFLARPSVDLVRYIRGARHYHIKVYLATQRWVDIHPHIRAVVRHLFIFRTVSGRDLEALSAEPGVDIARVPRLNCGEYVYVRR
ncbi:MAG: hypothetical protein NZ651_05050 [Candidatus Bipolaricaulota bacterium]|nr:hypothetical protein [Candidatus Bipolaricaulota bacterium]